MMEQEDSKKLETTNNEISEPCEKRETWSGKFDFFFSALGYAGNPVLLLISFFFFIFLLRKY